MAVSSPRASSNLTSVYNLDPDVWRRFRAWCVGGGLNTGEEVTRALVAHMRSRPLLPEEHETNDNAK